MPIKVTNTGRITSVYVERQIGQAIREVYTPLGDDLVAALKAEAPEASGRFKKRIKKRLSGAGLRTTLTVYHDPPNDPEAQAIEEGRKPGGRPPIANLLVWVRLRGLGARAFSVRTRRPLVAGTRRIRNRKSGKLRSPGQSLLVIQKGIAFAIARRIGEEGLPRKTGFPPSHGLFLFRDLKQRHAAEINAATATLSQKVIALLNR